MAICNVTGSVYLPSGEPAKSVTIFFSRVDKSIAAEYLGAVVPDNVMTATGRNGELDIDLLTGNYIMHVDDFVGGVSVPDALTANIADILFLTAGAGVEIPAWLSQALAARDAALQAATEAGVARDEAVAAATPYNDVPLTNRVVALENEPSVTWGNLPNKPATFVPATHTHSIAQVVGLQDALDSAGITSISWADVTSKPLEFIPIAHTHTWAAVTDKPTTFTPSSHNHAIADVSGLRSELDNNAASSTPFGSYADALAYAPTAPISQVRIGSVISGRLTEWVRQTGGTCLGGGWSPAGVTATLRHWGVIPGLTTDQSAGLILAFASTRIILDDGGTYYSRATIPVIHPMAFEGGGQGVTRFVFENMGGFSGLDGFDVQVSMDATRSSTTSIRNCDILSAGGFGRNGIKTPTNPGGEGLILYALVRPRFEFTNLSIGSRDRTSFQSTNMFGVDGWANCIHMGESADSVISHIQFIQPFVPNIATASWAGRNTCTGLYLNAGTTASGAGPVYHAQISHLTGHGCGRLLMTTGKVISPRVTEIDGFGNGWGIYCEGPLFNSAGDLDSVGEMSLTDCNLNGIFGGIRVEGTDFLHIDGVRVSWPSISGIEYAGNWYAIQVTGGFRQIDISGFRAASFSTTALATFHMADINGRSPYEPTATPGMLTMEDLYLSTGVSPSQWGPAITLRNVREASIDPPKARSAGGLLGVMMHIESDHTTTAPKIYMKGGFPYTFTTPATYGAGANARVLVWPEENIGMAALSQVSAAGALTVSPRGRSKYRQGFAVGSGPYTYDYNLSNDGAVEGQIISFWVQIAATNSTVRFRDEAGGVRLTLNPNGATTQYRVDCTWLDLAGTLSMRIQFASASIV